MVGEQCTYQEWPPNMIQVTNPRHQHLRQCAPMQAGE